eukprot:1207194-Rhodomonas_salina.1
MEAMLLFMEAMLLFMEAMQPFRGAALTFGGQACRPSAWRPCPERRCWWRGRLWPGPNPP